MSINFIPNDPRAAAGAPALRVQPKRANRPASRAGLTFSNTAPEDIFPPGTAEFLFWQCREAGLAAIEAWEASVGILKRWQGNRKKLLLLQDEGIDVNAFYDRTSFSFFHRDIGGTTFFSGASTDVVSHELGHGLLDSIRPDLWDAPFLETGAFHEAFGDCVALLTALNDKETRKSLLAVAASLRKKNFLESTAEDLSEGIRRLIPTHNAAEPRHAFNTLQYQIPETLPDDGGPGELINEVHSFGMLFSGAFYDLIANIFAEQSSQTEASLQASAKIAADILVGGAAMAVITPRFLQSVGRSMVLHDDQENGGDHRELIRDAFQRHNIMLGANTLLSPTAVLSGRAPRGRRVQSLGASTRKDLLKRLGVAHGKLSVDMAELSGRRVARVVHSENVPLGSVDKRLKGVSVVAPVSVVIGESGGRAAVMGQIPEMTSTHHEVEAFVKSLLRNNQIDLGGKKPAATGAPKGMMAGARGNGRGAKSARSAPVARETHRIRVAGGKKVLERVRFHCAHCGHHPR